MTPTADDMARDLAADLDYATDEVAGPSTAADLAAYSLAATGGWPAAIRRAVAAEAALAAERQERIDAEDRHCRAEARCVEGIRLFACDEAERKRLEARVKELEDSMLRSLARAGKDVMDGLRSIELRERLAAAEARVKELEAELARRPAPPQTIRVLVNGRDATEDELDRIALSSLARPETPPHDMEIPPEDVEARGGMAYYKKGKP